MAVENQNGAGRTSRVIIPIPSKKIIKDPADSSPEHVCIAELIDNCLDERARRGMTDLLRIDMRIVRDKKAKAKIAPIIGFEMKWNMPISQEDLKAFLTPGLSNNTDETIGVWGQGAKIATHGLAREWKLTTVDDKHVREIHIPEDWIEKEFDWAIKEEEWLRNGEKSNETTFLAIKLNENKWSDLTFAGEGRQEDRNFENGLMEFISRTYGKAASFMHIYLNGNEIELHDETDNQYVKGNYLFIPGYEPHIVHDTFTITHRGTKYEYKISVFIGLHKDAGEADAGVYLYGNGKLFQSAYKGKKLFSRYHAEWTRARIHLYIQGNPKFIPWGIPAKMYLREDDNNLLPKLEDIVSRLTLGYKEIVSMEKAHLNLFSLETSAEEQIAALGYDKRMGRKMVELFSAIKQYYEDNWDIERAVLSDECYRGERTAFRSAVASALRARDGESSRFASIDVHRTLVMCVLKSEKQLIAIASELGDLNKKEEEKKPEKPKGGSGGPPPSPPLINYPVTIMYPLGKDRRPIEVIRHFLVDGALVPVALNKLPEGYDYDTDENGKLVIVSESPKSRQVVGDLKKVKETIVQNDNVDYSELDDALTYLATALGMPNSKSVVFYKLNDAVEAMGDEIMKYRRTGYSNGVVIDILRLLKVNKDMIPRELDDK